VQDVVKWLIYLDEPGDILFFESEIGITLKMLEICPVTGDKIVETDHLMTFSQQSVSKMRAQKTSRAS